MHGKNYMPNVDAKSVIDEIKTNAVVKNEAVNLLKEIRLLSGINYRKYKALKYNKNSAYIEFNYINVMIDEFVDKNKLEGFKK
tara:strand:+ start:376 stop:624 length:249 start_codon:yes stop_codon:yes gene_type:complete